MSTETILVLVAMLMGILASIFGTLAHNARIHSNWRIYAHAAAVCFVVGALLIVVVAIMTAIRP